MVPVRADARSQVKGIVHDASGSGQTLFVEPLVAVELGNAWREAQLAEAAEIERILDELSALVGSQAEPLRETLDALARFDFWSAKARLAEEMDAVRAETAARPEISLKGARHPGLTGRVVPIDVELGADFRALVVTGPEHGRQDRHAADDRAARADAPGRPPRAGRPRAAGCPVLRDVFADIGDEQSVAQSLSTFSGHLRSIVRIAAAAGPATLVLLDELGAGTDPTEGSALAQALLDHFLRSRRPRGGHDPLRRAEGLRPHHAGGAQRVGRVRPRDALADLPPADRPARRQPGLRHRRAARPADGRSSPTPARA